MTVEEFVQQINMLTPSVERIIEQFKKKNTDFSFDEALSYREANMLRLTEIRTFGNQVEQLIYGTNIGSTGIGGINFRSNLKDVDEKLKRFASYNDFYRFCYSSYDSSIVVLTDDFEGEELMCKSFDHFLQFLVEYEKFNRKLVYDMDFLLQESLNKLQDLIGKGLSKRWVAELIPEYTTLLGSK